MELVHLIEPHSITEPDHRHNHNQLMSVMLDMFYYYNLIYNKLNQGHIHFHTVNLLADYHMQHNRLN